MGFFILSVQSGTVHSESRVFYKPCRTLHRLILTSPFPLPLYNSKSSLRWDSAFRYCRRCLSEFRLSIPFVSKRNRHVPKGVHFTGKDENRAGHPALHQSACCCSRCPGRFWKLLLFFSGLQKGNRHNPLCGTREAYRRRVKPGLRPDGSCIEFYSSAVKPVSPRKNMMRTTPPKGSGMSRSIALLTHGRSLKERSFIYLDIFLLPVNRSMNIFNAHLIRYPICLQSGPFLRIWKRSSVKSFHIKSILWQRQPIRQFTVGS